ncbi:MAG: hypothetical protein B6I25_06850 [Planctomycetales bacterium 4572_13]|nr:MAG: hypothetical protein B6I25_06850 [Planctomycetales bacterium 4572_13]
MSHLAEQNYTTHSLYSRDRLGCQSSIYSRSFLLSGQVFAALLESITFSIGLNSYEILFDKEFKPAKYPDRNIVLYGNSRTNSAWNKLLSDSPIQVSAGKVTIGDKTFTGDDIGSLFIRPRKDSDTACVTAISGTGIVGMRANDALSANVTGGSYWAVPGLSNSFSVNSFFF